MDPNRAVTDDVESNTLASVHGIAQSESRLVLGLKSSELQLTTILREPSFCLRIRSEYLINYLAHQLNV
ncbi:hypothetical protein EPI10_016418 [Gossypium australe]|uniref:Uncharacterized protein n=1 Tax=Gossypium australe TaxID=47621 RepID=A0A5B6VNU0_9ROSI|nr:hypothetical protein EPI10_016418 [Gossypium australe]